MTQEQPEEQSPQAIIDTGVSAPARPIRYQFADGERVIPPFIVEFFGGPDKFIAALGNVLQNFTWAEFASNYANLVTRDGVREYGAAFIADHFKRI